MIRLTKDYGSNYTDRKLQEYRGSFLKWHPVSAILWIHIGTLLLIEDKIKRNYYVNVCKENNLSVRKLIKEIKS